MDPEELIEHALRLAAAAEVVPDDVEDRLAVAGLEPTLRDRTLLLIEQTRMLAERSSDQADTSDRLRAAADHEDRSGRRPAAPDRDGQAGQLSRREATADARDDALGLREATADARDDTLEQRELAAGAREGRLDDRERSSRLSEESLRLRERAVAARAAAVDLREGLARQTGDEFAPPGMAPVVTAVERGIREAQQTAAPNAGPEFVAAAFDGVVAELLGTVPELVEDRLHRWVRHAHHELRQPMAVIGGIAETLTEHHRRLDGDALETLLAPLRRQIMSMQQIINQLELATHLQNAPVTTATEQVDLRPLVEQLRADYEQLLGDVTISYRRPEHPVLACVEQSAATQILLVLLRNAADHAPCHEPILIETIAGTDTVRVSIHDDGPGVPIDTRERIFSYGTRLSSGGSLGLGLFIARGLAQAHGGRLTVADSGSLGGARFDLTLPTDCTDATDATDAQQ